MNNNTLEILIPALVGIISSITTFFVAKTNNKKELVINDRKQLSEDERLFRQELRDSISMYKAEIMELRKEVKQYKSEINELSEEVRMLREVNTHLETENRKLVTKVDELTQQIIKLEKKADGSKGQK
jgi:uncharacterized coiled-coil DUF342 family protein